MGARAWALLGGAVVVGMVILACSDDDAASSNVAVDAGGDETTTEVDGAQGTGTIGAACSDDADCSESLTCRGKKTSGSDPWPAHGMCTAACETDDECDARVQGSVCGKLSSKQGFCLEPCTLGPPGVPLTAGPAADKCHGRTDLACSLLYFGGRIVSQCYPVCNDESACEGAGHCNLDGFCTIGAGAPLSQIGQHGGFCGVNLPGPDEICTAMCTLGVVPSCGWSGPGAKATAACIAGPTGAGRGDRGYCERLCDSESDCDDTMRCRPLEAAYATATGRTGGCVPDGDAGADAGDAADQ